jgi:hypothetical protein
MSGGGEEGAGGRSARVRRKREETGVVVERVRESREKQ